VAQHAEKQFDNRSFEVKNLTVFDRDSFESSTMYDAGLQVEILSLFYAQLNAAKQKMSSGLLTQQENKFLGHTLRGAAAAVGALEIEHIAQCWEDGQSDLGVLAGKLDAAITLFRKETAFYSH
jgi:HPt (histidine-containing phosphotransfer) domain-containing protein